MALTVREATELDLPQILSVYRDAGLDAQRSLQLPEAQRVFRKMSSYPWYRVYVAEADGEVVGTFALLVMDNMANGGVPSGIVEDVAVARAAQGQGVGRTMMRLALDKCRQGGCYKMLLSSNTNRAAAHRFYEALGFKRHGYSFRVEFEDGAPSDAPAGAGGPTSG